MTFPIFSHSPFCSVSRKTQRYVNVTNKNKGCLTYCSHTCGKEKADKDRADATRYHLSAVKEVQVPPLRRSECEKCIHLPP